MDERTMKAFAEEMASIQKQAGIGSMITKGIQGFKLAPKLGLKGHKAALKNVWERGSKAVGKGSTSGGALGGIRSLARSPYGAMAGTAGLGGLAGYGAYKAVRGDRGRQQQRY